MQHGHKCRTWRCRIHPTRRARNHSHRLTRRSQRSHRIKRCSDFRQVVGPARDTAPLRPGGATRFPSHCQRPKWPETSRLSISRGHDWGIAPYGAGKLFACEDKLHALPLGSRLVCASFCSQSFALLNTWTTTNNFQSPHALELVRLRGPTSGSCADRVCRCALARSPCPRAEVRDTANHRLHLCIAFGRTSASERYMRSVPEPRGGEVTLPALSPLTSHSSG